MKVLALRVLAWDVTARLPQRIDFIKGRISKSVDYSEIYISPIHTFGYYLGYIISFILTIPRLLRRNYDILLIENAYLVVFGIISRLSGKKVIAEYVDYYPDMLHRIYHTRKFRYFVAFMLCSMFSKLANFVIVETQLSKQIVISLGIPSKKIRVISQSPDLSVIKRQDRHEIRRKYGITDDEFVIGYLGKFPDHYGLELIPAATASAQKQTKRNLVLLMVGDGEFLSKIEEMTNENGYRAIFPGRVPFQEVSKYYSSFDVLIYTPNTASGIKLAEALVLGVPVIVGAGYATEFIKDGYNGFVAEPRAVEAYAKKIIEVESRTEEDLQNLSERIRHYAHKRFVLSHNQYLIMFNEVIKN
ncbi:MAG: glycosyltransferase [Candidatus Heimdallarchaeota archaeon]|nr:MAG: glycosyltransferase [Candidatus Heimdallarchaeota archaeon]